MTINHHPDIATLMAFSAGALEEPYAAVIATHLAMSEGGRETVRQMERIGGALLADEDDASLSNGALSKLMDRLDDEPIRVKPRGEPGNDLPLPLQAYLPKGLDSVKWRW